MPAQMANASETTRNREEGVKPHTSDQDHDRQHGERGQERETHRVRRVHETRRQIVRRRSRAVIRQRIDGAVVPHDDRLAVQRHSRAHVPGDAVEDIADVQRWRGG